MNIKEAKEVIDACGNLQQEYNQWSFMKGYLEAIVQVQPLIDAIENHITDLCACPGMKEALDKWKEAQEEV